MSAMDEDQSVLTSPEVADRLGVSVRTVHRMVKRGDLTVKRTLRGSNGHLFDRAVVEFFAKRWTPRPYRRRVGHKEKQQNKGHERAAS